MRYRWVASGDRRGRALGVPVVVNVLLQILLHLAVDP